MNPSPTSSRERRSVLGAGCGLALMFAGVWTCDNATLALADLPGGYLSIRFFSLITYGLALAFAWRIGSFPIAGPRADRRKKTLLVEFVIAGGVLFAIGVAALILAIGDPRNPLAIGGALLMKCVGPLLSVVLLFEFAALPHLLVMRTTAVAMAGAFAFEALAKSVGETVGASPVAFLALGAAALIGAGSVSLALLDSTRTAADADHETRETVPLSRPQLASVILCIAVTSLMLGFMRSGETPSNSVGTLAALVVLTGVLLAVRLSPAFDLNGCFRIATICVAAGLLFGPLLALLPFDGSALLVGIGTALFEMLIWVISAVVVRSQLRPLRAAAAVRLLAVAGHGLGALMAVGAIWASTVIPQATEGAGLIIVFLFVLMLLFVAKSDAALEEGDHADPQAEAIVSTTESSIPETPAAAPIGASAAVLDSAIPADGSRSDPSSAPVEDAAVEAPSTQHFWEDPCAELARTWGLTRREQEVLVQLAQGRDLAFMEERFTLSRNTVKMHIRNVYAKLGVHGKQEVIDLVEATRHRGAPFSPVPKP